ncbi:kinase-like domain-containing protein [Hypoxylon trugodes]|uniref:kinase-like domain-containing protein n=1 Tax=Hypoxylon trugodes TaxID=326681 RepID=UPI00218C974B|nr:kinase-like domain-containing protein [Hypoxylon trugodes]KAI1391666.1 kinase-like domain-containing protein [Hypoxylon trugodes]
MASRAVHRPGPPHELAIITLIPTNTKAHKILNHHANSHLLSMQGDGRLGLDIGHVRSAKPRTILATLGRDVSSDIVMPFVELFKSQCVFELNIETSTVLFRDLSSSKTTQIGGEGVAKFHGNKRTIDLGNLPNITISIGPSEPTFQFIVRWNYDKNETREILGTRGAASVSKGYLEHLGRALTLAPPEPETLRPSQLETVDPTPGGPLHPIVYEIMSQKGSGAFGQVFSCKLKGGGIAAVKQLWNGPGKYFSVEFIRREVDILSRLSHYITSQGWGTQMIEIFMGLGQGSLFGLLHGTTPKRLPQDRPFVESVFKQMLQALDYLSTMNIMHRNVKPENILYISDHERNLSFQLADFGLGHLEPQQANSEVGATAYMAPELGRETQSPKVDVWSLFMTIVWILDIEDFRRKAPRTISREDYHDIRDDALNSPLWKYKSMVEIIPADRASAAQILLTFFDGEGLSTPRKLIRPLHDEEEGYYDESEASEGGDGPHWDYEQA